MGPRKWVRCGGPAGCGLFAHEENSRFDCAHAGRETPSAPAFRLVGARGPDRRRLPRARLSPRTGSAQHALVKGEREKEATLFTLAGSLPGLTLSAERAARRIVRAAERGERYLTLGVLGKAFRLIHALAPGLSGFVLRNAAGLLPAAPPGPEKPLPDEAREHPTRLSQSFLTVLGRRAAARYNENRV